MTIRQLRTCGVLAATLLLAAPLALTGSGASAASFAVSTSPGVSVSEDAYVPKGQVHTGDLVAIFGKVRVEGTVTGQVVVIMGSLDLSGEVQGDTISILSGTRIGGTTSTSSSMNWRSCTRSSRPTRSCAP